MIASSVPLCLCSSTSECPLDWPGLVIVVLVTVKAKPPFSAFKMFSALVVSTPPLQGFQGRTRDSLPLPTPCSLRWAETSAEPSLQAKQLKLKRARLADDLNEKIAQRPGPMELVEKNILPVESSLKEAIIGEEAQAATCGLRTGCPREGSALGRVGLLAFACRLPHLQGGSHGTERA